MTTSTPLDDYAPMGDPARANYLRTLENFGVRAFEWRCFDHLGGGIDSIKQFNILVGKNNAGKSAVCELIKHVFDHQLREDLQKGETGTMRGRATERVRSSLGVTGSIPNFTLRYTSHSDTPPTPDCAIVGTFRLNGPLLDVTCGTRFNGSADSITPPFIKAKSLLLTKGVRVISMSSERDVREEPLRPPLVTISRIDSNGNGLTSHLDAIFNAEEGKYSNDAKALLLAAVKEVLYPDVHVLDIDVKTSSIPSADNQRTIVLNIEGAGNLVPLRDLGSGIRTVIHLLTLLHLSGAPRKGSLDLSAREPSVFVLEELEAHIHPLMLSRLLAHLYNTCRKKCHVVFLTTHSPYVIDFFRDRERTQLLHVVQREWRTSISPVSLSEEVGTILDDLGVKASYLLQANGVIWVEGPSDRIIFNKWIELVGGGQVKEHVHYEIAMYGGALVSHLSGLPDCAATEKLVHLFKINRNFCLTADRDSGRDATPKFLTAGLSARFNESDLWITCGWTLENLLPRSLVEQELELQFLTWDPYVNFVELIREVNPDRAEKWGSSPRKADFARSIAENMTLEHLDPEKDPLMSDLHTFLLRLIDQIKKWNHL